ncbi:MAG: PilZ domain-containing protein [Acidithiobacillus sp.]
MQALEIPQVDLGLMLPPRQGRSLGAYLEAIQEDFTDIVQENAVDLLKRLIHSETLVFTADSNDLGQRYSVLFCTSEALTLTLKNGITEYHKHPSRRSLVFIESEDSVYLFISDVVAHRKDIAFLSVPLAIYRRSVRKNKRLPLVSEVQMLRKEGLRCRGKLVDLSVAGACFDTRVRKFASKELMLIEFAVAECGVCELMVQIARIHADQTETLCRVGARLIINTQARQKMEYLLMCFQSRQLPAPSIS